MLAINNSAILILSTSYYTLKLKQLLPVILFSILLTAFTVQKYDSSEITQMVVTLPGLNSKALQMDLEADIHNLPGVQFIETSLISQTLILNYDPRKLSLVKIEHILHKWGCSPGESFFQNVVAMK